MSKTYEAIYTHDGRLTWLGERPAAGRHKVVVIVQDQPVRAQDGPPPTPEQIQHFFDEMQRQRNRKKTPEEIQRILDETRGAWGTEKTMDQIDREIDAMRAEGTSIGALALKSFRPLPLEEARAAFRSLATTHTGERRFRLWMHYAMGRCHEADGDHGRARAEYRRALDVDSGFELAKKSLAALPDDGAAGKKGLFSKLFKK